MKGTAFFELFIDFLICHRDAKRVRLVIENKQISHADGCGFAVAGHRIEHGKYFTTHPGKNRQSARLTLPCLGVYRFAVEIYHLGFAVHGIIPISRPENEGDNDDDGDETHDGRAPAAKGIYHDFFVSFVFLVAFFCDRRIGSGRSIKQMNLRSTFPFRQLLSATAAVLTLTAAPFAFAQTPAAPAAPTGSDYVVMKPTGPGAPASVKQGVLIIGMQGSRVMVKEGAGEAGYEVAGIQEVGKAAPPEFAQAQQLIEAGDFAKAAPLIKGIADKFKGLPIYWAQDSTNMLGSLYLNLDKVSEAEAAISAYETAYRGTATSGASAAKARLAAAKGRFAEAKALASSVVAGALSRKTVTRAESQIFGQGYFVLGQCAENEGKLPEAMENYARTVAVFYHERSVVAQAQKRIDELRKKGVTTP